MSIPTIDDVGRIARLSDPVVRNLQITQCYYELSLALCAWLGTSANWCTFATWASKQAGQTIRGEDLTRTFQDLVHTSDEAHVLLSELARIATPFGYRKDLRTLREILIREFDPQTRIHRAGEAVGRGNLKVFAEIGREFARFLDTFRDAATFEPARVDQFCAELAPGDPPEGQQRLREAFMAYSQARFTENPTTRAELIFYGNLLVGLHEQTRLQPEIRASLDAALADRNELRRRLIKAILPGAWVRLRLQFARLSGRPLPLDRLLDRLIDQLQARMREVITGALLTLHLADGKILRLGTDLMAHFPPVLARLSYPALLEVLARVDATPDSTRESGARDWADLPDRMHFITDFFRCYHTWEPLHSAPFTAEQIAMLRAGQRPAGPL